MEDIEHFDLTADEEALLAEDPDIPDHQVEDVYLFGQTWHIQHGGHFYGIAPAGHPFPNGFNGQPVEIGYPDDSPPPSPDYSETEEEEEAWMHNYPTKAEQIESMAIYRSRHPHLEVDFSSRVPNKTLHYIWQKPVPIEDLVE